jgi:hypothetical protein
VRAADADGLLAAGVAIARAAADIRLEQLNTGMAQFFKLRQNSAIFHRTAPTYVYRR